MGKFQQIEDVRYYLNNIPKFQDQGSSASNFALENIASFCAEMGNPQNKFPSIHVAGTNGKGTVCHLFEEVYRRNGYKTGLFTSPHLISYNERFRINGDECNDDQILSFFQENEELLEKIPLTYFEISTALAFWLFDKQEIDIAIFETGLGGRLDSTNIIKPKLSVITSIGLDHTDILGDTLEQISGEKAGIIKHKTPVILGNIQNSLLSVFKQKAQLNDAEILLASDLNPMWNNGIVRLTHRELAFETRLIESINKWNFATVFLGVNSLQNKFPVSEQNLIQVFQEFKGAPARFEKLLSDKEWYFSGAHNTEALQSTFESVERIAQGRKPVIVFSMMKDKLNKHSIKLLESFEKKFYVQLDTERAATFEEINNVLNSVQTIDETNQKSILKEFETSLVIFTGSFYFYSTVRRWVS